MMMSEWISVKDRLPIPGERVLCFAKWKSHPTAVGSDTMLVDYFGSSVPLDDGYVITHWMNLPKPPKENDDE